ncbi:hypothetical protein C0993_010430 [Termitomyces sp. T159_Od127]|nr:hypothetical protein C0993_010430 [Termitomyces sp. T159_Od127]
MARAGLRFTLDDGVPTMPFGPRRGTLVLSRPSGNSITLHTPTLLTPTSRGVVPHLTRSHVRSSDAIGLIHVPFETFLEQSPPVPTLDPGPNALHRLLGFELDRHIVSLSVRDPDDTRAMPPNGNGFLNACSLRGVRKITPAEWTNYTRACRPDVVVALSDTPHTAPPFSQKRLTKSIERSTAWLAALLAPNPDPSPSPAILVHLAGCASPAARAAFAGSLTEPLNALESTSIGGLPTYDAGVAGYTADLRPLRLAISSPDQTTALLHASLAALPPAKPRFAHGATGPHDVLRLIRDVGIDVLDARWAVDAASCGVALDFAFPVPVSAPGAEPKRNKIGHNLYDTHYRLDFRALSSSPCPCIACAPTPPTHHIVHGPFESPSPSPTDASSSPYTRAYLHHLLHTHEMSAHSFLTAHNLAVVDALLDGVRGVLASPSSSAALASEVQRFEEAYRDIDAEGESVMHEARTMWADVDRARGKGRLKREREHATPVEAMEPEDGVGSRTQA